jgi:hypothetical protein
MLQGFPETVVDALSKRDDDQMTDSLFRDLAGNAYSGTVFASVLVSLLLHFPARCVDICREWAQPELSKPTLPIRRGKGSAVPELDAIISKP